MLDTEENQLLLGYGERLARSGRLSEALSVYAECPVEGGRARELAGVFLEAAVRPLSAPPPPPLACPSCRGVLVLPVTPPCGHTSCRSCLGRDCPRCRRPVPLRPLRDNVFVKAAVEKWWPARLEAARLRHEALALARASLLESALNKFNQALRMKAEDHLLLEGRSEVLWRLNRLEASLLDAELVTRLRPHWPKGYYRKGVSLAGLGHYEEALIAFSLCVSLDKNYISSVKFEVTKTLQRLLSPAMPCKSMFLSRHPLSPWWPPNYIHEDVHPMVQDDILETFSSSTNGSNCTVLGNRKLHTLLDRISIEIERLKRINVDPGELELRSDLVDQSDFDCVLCCRTLWRPVTTPCGHTYCSMCLERCLDYSANCPLCMTPLTEYLATSEKSVTEFIETSLLMGLPREYTSRLMAHRQEVCHLANTPDVPVFVCTTAFPSVPCPLFVFEPRYRLMVRRALDSGSRRFGIAACLKQLNGAKRFADYGTILEIKDWVLMNDGCSILTNVGIRRFRVVSRGERDGYDTARVQYLVDSPIPQHALPEIRMLHDQVREHSQIWFNKMSSEWRTEILRTFGDMPELEPNWPLLEDGPAWMWWLLAILPLGPHLQVGILGTTCLEKRLRAIEKTLRHLEQGPGCVQAFRGPSQAGLKRGQPMFS